MVFKLFWENIIVDGVFTVFAKIKNFKGEKTKSTQVETLIINVLTKKLITFFRNI